MYDLKIVCDRWCVIVGDGSGKSCQVSHEWLDTIWEYNRTNSRICIPLAPKQKQLLTNKRITTEFTRATRPLSAGWKLFRYIGFQLSAWSGVQYRALWLQLPPLSQWPPESHFHPQSPPLLFLTWSSHCSILKRVALGTRIPEHMGFRFVTHAWWSKERLWGNQSDTNPKPFTWSHAARPVHNTAGTFCLSCSSSHSVDSYWSSLQRLVSSGPGSFSVEALSMYLNDSDQCVGARHQEKELMHLPVCVARDSLLFLSFARFASCLTFITWTFAQ